MKFSRAGSNNTVFTRSLQARERMNSSEEQKIQLASKNSLRRSIKKIHQDILRGESLTASLEAEKRNSNSLRSKLTQ
jgi:hypothetical protein